MVRMSQFLSIPPLGAVGALEEDTSSAFQELKALIPQHGAPTSLCAAKMLLHALLLMPLLRHTIALTSTQTQCLPSKFAPSEGTIAEIILLSVLITLVINNRSILLSLRAKLALSWSKLAADFPPSKPTTQLASILRLLTMTRMTLPAPQPELKLNNSQPLLLPLPTKPKKVGDQIME
jgi:hypothetical protein